jgi:hypothetical protein
VTNANELLATLACTVIHAQRALLYMHMEKPNADPQDFRICLLMKRLDKLRLQPPPDGASTHRSSAADQPAAPDGAGPGRQRGSSGGGNGMARGGGPGAVAAAVEWEWEGAAAAGSSSGDEDSSPSDTESDD